MFMIKLWWEYRRIDTFFAHWLRCSAVQVYRRWSHGMVEIMWCL